MNLLEQATDMISVDDIKSLTFGEEKRLNSKFTMYHYMEDDVVVLVRHDDWTEIVQLMYNDTEVEFEIIDEDEFDNEINN